MRGEAASSATVSGLKRALRRSGGRAPSASPGDAREPDRRQGDRRGGPRLPLIRGEQDELVVERREKADAGREPGLVGGHAERARDVPCSDLPRGAHVDQHRPVRHCLDDAHGRRGRHAAARGSSRRCASSSAASARDRRSRARRSAPTVISASIGLKRRSKPSVEEVLADMPRPQSEPATWPGKSSTPSRSFREALVQRAVERRRALLAARPRGRGARCRPRTARRPTARATARRRACGRETTMQQCSGRWPGVWRTSSAMLPTSMRSPSRERPVLVDGVRRSRGSRSRRPCCSASTPWPETWSACVCVSTTPTSFAPWRLQSGEHLAHVERRVDDDGLAGHLAAHDVGGAAEVAPDDLFEDHSSPSPRAITRRWISLVPSPISRIFASR